MRSLKRPDAGVPAVRNRVSIVKTIIETANEIVQEATEKRAIAKEMVAGIKARLTPQEIAAALAKPDKTLGLLDALVAKYNRDRLSEVR